METKDSLLAHLALRFATHPENLAVEALGYLFGESADARSSFIDLLRGLGIGLPDSLSFSTQVTGEDATRPDLAGKDGAGREVVLIEAKFWAGLTERQPVSYLERLGTEANSALVFVVPAIRLESLWPELLRLTRVDGRFNDLREASIADAFRIASVDSKRNLLAISWRRLLDTMVAAVNDSSASEDIRQLQGLCERMDQEAFVPMRLEEFGQEFPRRVGQLNSLVDDVVTRCVDIGLANIKGLRATAMAMGYGRYLRLGTTGAWLGVSFDWWSSMRPTPLWLDIKAWREDPETLEDKKARLQELVHEQPPMLIENENSLLVPLRIPTMVERSEVVRTLVDQVAEVRRMLDGGVD